MNSAENASTVKVGLYDLLELEFEAALDSPVDNSARSAIVFNGIFTDGITTLTIPGFWFGGNVWKLRFSPVSEGVWNWSTNSDDPSLDGKTGSLTCIGSSKKGFLQVDRTNPHVFCYSNGTKEYLWGNTAYSLLRARLECRTEDWQSFFKESKSYGMNKLRVLVIMWFWGNYDIENVEKDHYPWDPYTRENPQFTAFKPEYWEGFDDIVEYASINDMFIELILFPDYSYSQGDTDHYPGDKGLYEMTGEDERRSCWIFSEKWIITI